MSTKRNKSQNKDWPYEEEARLFSHKKEKVYYEIYEYPKINLNKVNARIECITLGLKFPQDKVPLIKKIITNMEQNMSQHFEPIKIQQAKLDPSNEFKLIYQTL